MSARARFHGSYKKKTVPTFNHKVYVIKYNLGEVKIESSQCDSAWWVPLKGLSRLPFGLTCGSLRFHQAPYSHTHLQEAKFTKYDTNASCAARKQANERGRGEKF